MVKPRHGRLQYDYKTAERELALIIMSSIVVYSQKYSDEVVTFIIDILEGELQFMRIDRPDIYDITTYYQVNDGNFWLALHDGKIVGTIGLFNSGEARAYLKRMYVDPAMRGTGVAQNLLFALFDFAREKGYREIYLGTNSQMKAAVKFYEKMGFGKIEALPSDMPSSGDTLFYHLTLAKFSRK